MHRSSRSRMLGLNLIDEPRAFDLCFVMQKRCTTHLGLALPVNKCTHRPRKGTTATTAVAIDALHAHYLPISNRFDCHGNRAAFFPAPIIRLGGKPTRGEKGREFGRSVHSVLTRFALDAPSERLNELTATKWESALVNSQLGQFFAVNI